MEKEKLFLLVLIWGENALKTWKCEALDKFIQYSLCWNKTLLGRRYDAYFAMMDYMVERTSLGVQEIVFGDGSSACELIGEFLGKKVEEVLETLMALWKWFSWRLWGCEKYHLGHHITKRHLMASVEVTMAQSFSFGSCRIHCLGMARAAQRLQDTSNVKSYAHVDPRGRCFCRSKGLYERLFKWSQVRGYKVSGTIHLCIDNKLAFTTNPKNSRVWITLLILQKWLQHLSFIVMETMCESCLLPWILLFASASRMELWWLRWSTWRARCLWVAMKGTSQLHSAVDVAIIYKCSVQQCKLCNNYYVKMLSRRRCQTNGWQKISKTTNPTDDVKKTAPKLKALWFGRNTEGTSVVPPGEYTGNTIVSRLWIWPRFKSWKNVSEVPWIFKSELVKLLETCLARFQGKENWTREQELWATAELTEGHSVRLSGQDCVRGTFTYPSCRILRCDNERMLYGFWIWDQWG